MIERACAPDHPHDSIVFHAFNRFFRKTPMTATSMIPSDVIDIPVPILIERADFDRAQAKPRAQQSEDNVVARRQESAALDEIVWTDLKQRLTLTEQQVAKSESADGTLLSLERSATLKIASSDLPLDRRRYRQDRRHLAANALPPSNPDANVPKRHSIMLVRYARDGRCPKARCLLAPDFRSAR